MKRRHLLATTAATTALVGCLSGPDDEGAGEDDDAPTEPPFEIATLDASGSESGTITVPDSSRSLLCNFTRTECPTSRGFLSTLAEAMSRLEGGGYAVGGADPDVRFLSVTDGTSGPSPTDDELAAWFEANGGNWWLGRDEPGTCYDYYGIDGYPTTILVDSVGTVHWRNRGESSPGTVTATVRDALEADAGGSDGGNESAGNRTDG
ncbi:TlpA family protein disulfide reductase [Natrinema sp. H-ect1]|uniref:TlpA family protein disulfide reductase n=1 Tax=Natrinema sp. H-ect1 TaxID=3242700 RepID=UPI00359EDA7A